MARGGVRAGVGCLHLLLVLNGACGSEPIVNGKTVVTLLDLSESTRADGGRAIYCENVRQILHTAQPGDAIVMGWITENSAQELSLPVKEVIPPFDPGTDNPLMVRRLRAHADSTRTVRMDSIGNRVCSFLEEPGRKVMKTDIMTSVSLASRVFTSYPNPRKYLIVMSDMIEESDEYNFQRIPLGVDETTEIIQSQSDGGRLPDLTGVQVYVMGAGAVEQARYFEVRAFWRRYFEAMGSSLRDEDYGGAMIRLPD